MICLLLHRFNSQDDTDVYNCSEAILLEIIKTFGAQNYVDPSNFAKSQNSDGWFITVDDGNSTDVFLAKFLSTYNFRAVFFINPGLINSQEHSSIADLRTIVELGHYLGNHSFEHLNLVKLNKTQVLRQIGFSIEWFQRNNFKEIKYFAYPWGRNNFFIRRIVKKMGYDYAFGVTSLKFDHKSPRLVLPRLAVTSQFDFANVSKLQNGRYFRRSESWFREFFRIFLTLKRRLID